MMESTIDEPIITACSNTDQLQTSFDRINNNSDNDGHEQQIQENELSSDATTPETIAYTTTDNTAASTATSDGSSDNKNAILNSLLITEQDSISLWEAEEEEIKIDTTKETHVVDSSSHPTQREDDHIQSEQPNAMGDYSKPTIVNIPGLSDSEQYSSDTGFTKGTTNEFENVPLISSDHLINQQQPQEQHLQQQRDEFYKKSVATISLPWQYDDLVMNCYSCSVQFVPILQSKHHCRLCGNIFCQNCSSKRCLIPPTRIVLVPKGGKKAKPPLSFNENHISFASDPDPDAMLTYITTKSYDDQNNSSSQHKEQYILYGKGLEQRITLARQPLRVCDSCHNELQSIQEELRNTNSNAVRFNTIDPSDHMKRMMNSPLAFTLGHEIRKAAYTLNNLLPLPKRRTTNVFTPMASYPYGSNGSTNINTLMIKEEIQQCKDTCVNVSPTLSDIDGVRIPAKLLEHAKGIAVLTVLKGGFGFAGAEFGTGLVVAKLPPLGSLGNGTSNGPSSSTSSNNVRWSAPSAIGMAGISWGALIGAQISDHVFVLMTNEAVELLFTANTSIQLGVDVGVAVGPLGRSLEGDVSLSTHNNHNHTKDGKPISIYTYSLSRGLYAGISLDGKMIVTRHNVNEKFYGYKIDGYDILNGIVPTPPAAQPLYEALARCHVYASMDSASSSTTFNSLRTKYRENINPQQVLYDQQQKFLIRQQNQQAPQQVQNGLYVPSQDLFSSFQQPPTPSTDSSMYQLESRQVLNEYGEVPDGVPLPSNPYHYL